MNSRPSIILRFGVAVSLATVTALAGGEAAAQTISRLGSTVALAGAAPYLPGTPTTMVRGVDAAYDPETNTYLVVAAQNYVLGVCTTASGVALGPPITIKPDTGLGGKPFGSFPRARYSPDVNGGAGGFLVTWPEEQVTGANKLKARVVSCTDGVVGTEQEIDGGFGPFLEAGAAIAYSATSQKFLVVWNMPPMASLRARFVDLNGAGIGSTVALSPNYGRNPGVAWNSDLNEFGVSFSGESTTAAHSGFARVPASDITAFTRTTFNNVPGCMTYISDIDYNRQTGRYVMGWFQSCGGYAAKTAEFESDGTLVDMQTVSTFGSHDALGLAYSPVTTTFAMVGLDRATDHVQALELDAHGDAIVGTPATISTTTPSNFYPRIAANTTEATWNAVFSASTFKYAANQVLQTSSPPVGTGCTYSLSSTSNSGVAASGGAGNFTVTTDAGCSWTASTGASWITITGGTSGTGSGTVSYTVATNTGIARSATITAGGRSHTVSQLTGITPGTGGTYPGSGATTTGGIAKWGTTTLLAGAAPYLPGTPTTMVRGVDAAYDPDTNTYLVVAAQNYVLGVCTTASGVALGSPIMIKPDTGLGGKPFGSFPRARYSPDVNGGAGGFLVTWPEEQVTGANKLKARVVSCTDGLVGTEQEIDGGFGPFLEAGAAIGYSATSQKFLVVWNMPPMASLRARFVDLNGAGIGSTVALSPNYGRNPGVAWNSDLNEFGVSFSGESTTAAHSGFARVPASDITAFTRTTFNTVPGCMTYISDIGYNSSTGRYVMGWFQSCGGYAAKTAEFNADGTLVEMQTVSTFGSHDALGLAYNPATTTFAMVGLDRATDHVQALELDAHGDATLGAAVTVSTSSPSNFYPRVVANSSEKTWNAVFSASTFKYVGSQIVVTGSGPSGSCTYSLSASSSGTIAYTGGSGSFGVTTQSGCAWTAATASGWISITSGASGTGSGTVSYSVAANAATSIRTGTILAGGQTYTVTQAAAPPPPPTCTYSLSPTSNSVVAAGGTGSFTVTTQSGCTWTATTTASWITVTSGASGTGSGTVAYSVSANASTSVRIDTVAVADQVHTITQAGAVPSGCSLGSVKASPAPPAGASGVERIWQTSGITVTSGQVYTVTPSGTWSKAGVSYTAAGHPTATVTGHDCPLSGAPTLSLIGRVGTTGTPFLIGTGTTITPSSSGVLYLAPNDLWYQVWNNAGTLSVNVCATGTAGCTYTLSASGSSTIPAGGGDGSFDVTTDSGCSWTATTSAGWITITGGASSTGSGTVTFHVAENTTTSARTGTITAGGQTYTVTQSANSSSSCQTATVRASPTPPAGASGVERVWQASGITVTAGQVYTITASGTWTKAGVSYTAAGHPTATVTGHDCPLSGAHTLALVGRVGTGGTPFLIGTGTTVTPGASGTLYLAPNDLWYQVWDNAGTMSVSVCTSSSCTYSLTPTSSGTIASGGGSGSFSVSSSGSCGWTSTTASAWITITGGTSGTGAGTVSYSVAANTGTSTRTGTIIVGDQTFTVTQAGSVPSGCLSATVLASPTPPAGASGVERVWQSSGISLTAGQSYTITPTGTWSKGGVAYTAAGNPSATVTGHDCPLSGGQTMALIGRVGATGTPFLIATGTTVTPVAGGVLYLAPNDLWYQVWNNSGSLSVSVCTLSSCSYTLSPTSSGTLSSDGASGSFTVTSDTGCDWTATTTSSWITITAGATGSGTGTVSFTAAANTGTARTGTIVVAGQTYTVSQAAGSSATCSTVNVLASPPPPSGLSGVDRIWQGSGITLTAGVPVTLTAPGTWTYRSSTVTAAGSGSVTATGSDVPLSGQPALALIAKVGSGGTPFVAGTGTTFTPSTTGVLYFAPNDLWYMVWGNSGSLSVTVCR